MAEHVTETGSYLNLSASASVVAGACDLIGIFVASASGSPTIKVWDSLTAAAPILVNTFVPSAASFYPIPAYCGTGIYVTIGGTVDCTVFYKSR